MYSATTATRKIARLSKKIRAVQGGTSASKTISILLVLIAYCQTKQDREKLVSVVSESVPHLKRGAMRDFKNILKAHGYWRDDRWNATDSIYTFETGNQLEFFSADNADKLRGGRRDVCFMNEANNMSLETFDQLEVRTREFIFLDWNPTTEFWYYTDVEPLRTDAERIIITYRDNEALSPEIIAAIEARKNRKGWYQVYGLGQLGEVEGRIYTGWTVIDEVPKDAKLRRRYLDYGYSNDPTAIGDIYQWNGGIVLDEQLHKKGMSNRDIATVLLTLDPVLVVADSSEPKSNDELKSYGVDIVPAVKGPGSVNQGIQLVQDQIVYVTRRSFNILREYRGYLWIVDKNGKILNEPVPGNDHHMDGSRYGIQHLIGTPVVSYTPVQTGGVQPFDAGLGY